MNSRPGQVCNRDGQCTYKGCKYLHLAQEALPKDPCKYGERCIKEDCKFGHPDTRQTPGNRYPNGGPGGPRPHQGKKQCRYGPSCTRKDTCGYLHDGPAEEEGRFSPPPGVAMRHPRGPENGEEFKGGSMMKFARDDEEQKSRQKPCFKGNACQNPECQYAHDPNVGPRQPPKKPCFKGRQCINPECPYSHDVEAPMMMQQRPPRKQNPCFKGTACTKADCPYSHDPNAAPVQVRKPCRSGPACTKHGCPYNHDPNAAEQDANGAGQRRDVLIRRADPGSKPIEAKLADAAEKYNCVACTLEAKTIMIKPCNHMVFCDKCLKTYDQSKGCPMCRQPIQSVEKIFI